MSKTQLQVTVFLIVVVLGVLVGGWLDTFQVRPELWP